MNPSKQKTEARRPLMAVGLLLTWLLGAPLLSQEAFKVVAGVDFPTSTITKRELSLIFLKKMTRLDGVTVEPVDQVASSEVRKRFSSEIHGRSPGAIKAYWRKQIFSGRESPPREFSSSQAVLDFLERTPASVGYVSISTQVDSGLKVLRVN